MGRGSRGLLVSGVLWGAEQRLQDAMYQHALEEANRAQEDLQYGPSPVVTRSDSISSRNSSVAPAA